MDNSTLLHHLHRCGHYLYKRRGQRPTQIRILGMLNRFGTLSQQQIQEHLHVAQGSLSETLIKLQDKGLVEKTKNPKDRRCSVLRLTPAGRLQADADREITGAEDARLFEALSETEKEQLDALLVRLLDSWTGEKEC